jgi:hypothetical protein
VTADSIPQTISTRMKSIFRKKKPTVASKNPQHRTAARQQISTQEANSESGLEMTNLQQDRSSSRSGNAMTPIPREFMAVIQNGRTGREERGISGFVILESSMQAIAFDPRMLSQYSRKDVKIVLSLVFFLSATIALSTGIVLWINSLYGIMWTILTIGGLFKQVGEYLYFVLTVVRKARRFKEKPYIERPVGGTRAPPPSINDAQTQVEPQSVSESSEPAFDPRDRIDADRIINALPPRRRQTFEAADEDGDDAPRQPTRTDTEANIGL